MSETTVSYLYPSISLHVFESENPGPTLLFQAGIHGDEVAGTHALWEMLESQVFRPSKGRILVIPVMNPAAYRERSRMRAGGKDLNRCFPGDANSAIFEDRLAAVFMNLVVEQKPDLVCTLHESHKRYDPQVSPSFGQTIVYGVDPRPAVVDRVVARMNERLEQENERWAPLCFPVATSSTEVIVERIGCVGLCIETWMGFDERRRIEMQKQVVQALMDDWKMNDSWKNELDVSHD